LNGIAELFQVLTPRLGVLVLVMARVGGLIMTAPLLGAQAIPVRVRAALVLFIGFAIHQTVVVDHEYVCRLMPELYEVYNPMPYDGARDREVELAISLREKGYGVWQG